MQRTAIAIATLVLSGCVQSPKQGSSRAPANTIPAWESVTSTFVTAHCKGKLIEGQWQNLGSGTRYSGMPTFPVNLLLLHDAQTDLDAIRIVEGPGPLQGTTVPVIRSHPRFSIYGDTGTRYENAEKTVALQISNRNGIEVNFYGDKYSMVTSRGYVASNPNVFCRIWRMWPNDTYTMIP